jgi:hypothetical protein
MTAIDRLRQPTSIVPPVVFRVAFGLLMFAGAIRFMANGWIEEFYLRPDFHFTYYGFDWIKPLPGPWLYLVYGAVAVLSLCIAAGLLYRFSITTFFLLFTYTELLDKTYYLNHYYFVSMLSFLLIFLPLHRNFSIDSLSRPGLKTTTVPAWTLFSIRFQLGLVYFFAGVAKLNADWLLNAMPLKIWLAARTDTPLAGWLFDYPWTAYLMSWGGAAYDLTILFLLLYRPTRLLAYLAVVGFHGMTGLLFNIGMFPYIMIACTLIFFSADDFHWLWQKIKRLTQSIKKPQMAQMAQIFNFFDPIKFLAYPWRSLRFGERFLLCENLLHPALPALLIIFFALQLLLPLRHWLYPGNVLWTEEGYRFAWKVMLAEKTGHVTFTVTDPAGGQSWVIFPGDYLTYQQEKQMSFQPDMILQFAHYLEQHLQAQGFTDLEIRAEAYVSLNGRPSRLLLDPTVDLTAQRNTLTHKPWILLD